MKPVSRPTTTKPAATDSAVPTTASRSPSVPSVSDPGDSFGPSNPSAAHWPQGAGQPRVVAPLDAAIPLTQTPAELQATARELMASAKAELDVLKEMRAPRDPMAVLECYDRATTALGLASGRAEVAENMHPSKDMRDAGKAISQELSSVFTEISLDKEIYARLNEINLDAIQDAGTKYWLFKELRSFRLNGINLDEAGQNKIRDLNARMKKVSQAFGDNINADVREIKISPEQLDGMPEDYQTAHPVGADGKVTLTTNNTDYQPFMQYAKNPAAREALWRAYNQRAYPANVSVLKELIALRNEKAQLLGFNRWADLSTSTRMVKTSADATAFITKIRTAVRERSKVEYNELLTLKKELDPTATRVFPWDAGYLSNLLQKRVLNFDPSSVRPYFESNAVKQGTLDITAKLLGIEFARVKNAPVWHEEVEAYDVKRDGAVLGRIYLDLYPRDNKYKHYAFFTLATGKEGHRLPEGVVAGNFPRPVDGKPALLEHRNVETFFHEFGHAVHGILGSHGRWAGNNGIATEEDFVEAPSQLLEEWTVDEEVLATFAKHVETGQPLPSETVKKLALSADFGKGMQYATQSFYAALSLALYNTDPAQLDVEKVVRELYEQYTPYDFVEGYQFQTAFGHLDGYSSNYYTYLWSLVIAKAMAKVFEKDGWMNAKTGARYAQTVLEPGGAKPAQALVEDFLQGKLTTEPFEEWLKK